MGSANGGTTPHRARHSVVLHARNEERGREAMSAVPGAETVVTGDLTSIAQTRNVAEQVNALGSFDAVVTTQVLATGSLGASRPKTACRMSSRSYARSLYLDRAHSQAQASRLSEFRPSSER